MQSICYQLHFDEIRVVSGVLRLLAFHVGSLRWREKNSRMEDDEVQRAKPPLINEL